MWDAARHEVLARTQLARKGHQGRLHSHLPRSSFLPSSFSHFDFILVYFCFLSPMTHQRPCCPAAAAAALAWTLLPAIGNRHKSSSVMGSATPAQVLLGSGCGAFRGNNPTQRRRTFHVPTRYRSTCTLCRRYILSTLRQHLHSYLLPLTSSIGTVSKIHGRRIRGT